MVSDTSRNGGAVMIGLNRRRTMGGSKQENYIQDGLVFHLDCADYDSTLNTWVDKIGSVSFAMSNVSVDSLGGAVFNGTNSKGVASVALNNHIDTSTIEVAIKVNSSKTQFVLDSGISYAIGYGFYNNNTEVIYSMAVSRSIANVPNILGNLLTNSICGVGLQKLNVVNGNIGTFDSNSNGWSISQNYATIGVRGNNYQRFDGTIYQIRIYNRHLTKDEMIYNQQIDMRKYNSN